jgi:hypothetical protein
MEPSSKSLVKIEEAGSNEKNDTQVIATTVCHSIKFPLLACIKSP